jgi:hypothetical protein
MSEKLSFDDVLQEIMLKEKTPSYEALLRWQEGFPQYRDSLAEFFADWAVQEDLPEELEPQIDEESILAKGVEHAMQILERQGRLVSENSIEPLTAADQLVLGAVCLLRGEGNGVSITDKVSELCGSEALLGTTFSALSRLEKRGLIEAWQSDPETELNGKSTRHFTITIHGERALVYATEKVASLATALGGLL